MTRLTLSAGAERYYPFLAIKFGGAETLLPFGFKICPGGGSRHALEPLFLTQTETKLLRSVA